MVAIFRIGYCLLSFELNVTALSISDAYFEFWLKLYKDAAKFFLLIQTYIMQKMHNKSKLTVTVH